MRKKAKKEKINERKVYRQTQHCRIGQLLLLSGSFPSCCPGFESQAQYLRFFQFVIEMWCEKDENNQKEAEKDAYFLRKHNNLEIAIKHI